MTDCVFCRIISGEIPSLKVFEDEFAVAFLDIQPVNLGHALVVPKAHHRNFSETPDETVARLFTLVKRIAAAALDATGAAGYNIGINTGEAAGQVVMHTHVHVMPRFDGDGLKLWPKKSLAREQMSVVADAMRNRLKV